MEYTNDTGCKVTRSEISGDIVCQEPGPDCDCLIVATRADEPEERPMVRMFVFSSEDLR